MYKPWICYRVRSYFIFLFIFNFGNPAEIRTLNQGLNSKRGTGRGQGGMAQHARVYISEPFLNVKAVHFWEVLNFFLFPFFLQAFCSELLLYIANDLKEYKKICEVHLKKTYSIALVQYTKKTLIKKKQY